MRAWPLIAALDLMQPFSALIEKPDYCRYVIFFGDAETNFHL
jgi:hypothetical protein